MPAVVKPGVLRVRIERWLRLHGMNRDTRLYSRTSWRTRGEAYGNRAALTLTAEGAFYRLWNAPESASDIRTIGDFGKLLHDAGYWYDQGFTWSWHFYPASNGRGGTATAGDA